MLLKSRMVAPPVTRRLSAFLLSVLFVSLAFQNNAAGAVPSTPSAPKRVSLTGTISLYGCSASASQIRIIALPIEVRTPENLRPRRARSLRTARSVRARLASGLTILSDTRFAIPNLNQGVLYKLSVGIDEAVCGKIFWRGPEAGIVPGGARNIKIEGFAARSELEIFDQNSDAWVGADHIDFTDDSRAVRQIRWRSTLPAVQSAELQLATDPFPITGNFGACDEPESGILYRQELPAESGLAADGWQMISDVNFKALLPAPSRTGEGLSPGLYRQLSTGKPFYLRVVPLADGRRACDIKQDGVHGWVILAKLPGFASSEEDLPDPPAELEIGNNNTYLPPMIDPDRHPSAIEFAYLVTKPHPLPPKKCYSGLMTKEQFAFYYFNDPLGCLLVNHASVKPGTILTPGKWFWYYQKVTKSGGWNPISGLAGAFGGLVTGTLGVLGSGVNYLHHLSQEIEGALVNSILEIVTVVDVLDACGTLKSAGLSCKSLVKAGLKSGMLAMGVPPVSIPNWEQLKNQGYDYLAGSIANEIANATGVPAELTEDKIKELSKFATTKAIEEITKQRQVAPQYGYNWIIPYEGFDPAVWTLTIKKNTVEPLSKNLHLTRSQSYPPIYLGGDTKIPYLFPDSSILQVPMVLPFNFAAVNPPRCRTDRYLNTTCIEIPFIKFPICESEQLQDSKSGQYKWVPVSCEFFNSAAISRYYRDRWFSKYRDPVGTCVQSMVHLFSDANGLNIPYPFPQLVGLMRVRSDLWSIWNGFIHLAAECP